MDVSRPFGPNRNKPAGLYLHIPFCRQKCLYCGFYSKTDLGKTDGFVLSLCREMKLYSVLHSFSFDTVYIGGGTPSVLGPDHIEVIVQTLASCFDIHESSEITMEINPKTVSCQDLKAYKACGINRINIGVQSFNDLHLKTLGRIHNANQAIKTIEDARQAGFDNVGIDLIYGVPCQTMTDLTNGLKMVSKLAPDHISCYMLTIEPDTVFEKNITAGRILPLDETTVSDMYECVQETLCEYGYDQYEVSNFSRHPAMRSRHNMKYWEFVPYLGLGPSAHSYDGKCRYWNIKDVDRYMALVDKDQKPVEQSESLSRTQQMIEMIFLGLRTQKGIDVTRFNQLFNVDFLDTFQTPLAACITHRLIEVHSNRVHVTRKGFRFVDGIADRFNYYIG